MAGELGVRSKAGDWTDLAEQLGRAQRSAAGEREQLGRDRLCALLQLPRRHNAGKSALGRHAGIESAAAARVCAAQRTPSAENDIECGNVARAARIEHKAGSVESGEHHPQAESDALQILLPVRRREARREAVPIQRPADPAETEGDLVRRLKLRLCGKAAKRF